ncbi:gram-negative bacteria-binding protein 3-like [Scaptodrosophila lebanonensis]|uniref:Gram-negative bacteria-binding protein 3-like n=1 Tax=Drosophila lebanonensis TaxID=7225 RepID=A0A6J2TFR4_DROLE|nr:gram-negative bacteria-binding protein 3-like [Scaptodrosophila lebanonensis]
MAYALRFLGIATICWYLTSVLAYEVPKARIQVFYPKGFEVSIPDEPGITLFAFHGKLNEEMEGLEAGTWARDIVKAKNGRWTFRDRIASLKPGDTLYYWTYVIYNGLGYREDDGQFVVGEYSDLSEAAKATSSPPVQVYEIDIRRPGSSGTTGCSSTDTIVNGVPRQCAGQLVFVDDFNDGQLNAEKWKLERRFSGAPDYEFVIYMDDAANTLNVNNGQVTLQPQPTRHQFRKKNELQFKLDLGSSCTGALSTMECVRDGSRLREGLAPFITAQFSSKDYFSFKYGRVEIRAKMPRADWVFPQLLLQPKVHEYGPENYQSGQLRIAYARKSDGKLDLYAGALLNAIEPLRSLKLCHKTGEVGSPNADWSDSFHTYTLNWTKHELQWLVDGVELCHLDSRNGALSSLTSNGKRLPNASELEKGSGLAPFDQEFYLTFGLSVGGFNEFLYDAHKPWGEQQPIAMIDFWAHLKSKLDQWLEDASLQIDYVKVYTS